MSLIDDYKKSKAAQFGGDPDVIDAHMDDGYSEIILEVAPVLKDFIDINCESATQAVVNGKAVPDLEDDVAKMLIEIVMRARKDETVELSRACLNTYKELAYIASCGEAHTEFANSAGFMGAVTAAKKRLEGEGLDFKGFEAGTLWDKLEAGELLVQSDSEYALLDPDLHDSFDLELRR